MKDKNSMGNMVLRLMAITLCAGLVLGVVYSITKTPIAEQETKKATEARQEVLVKAEGFEQIDLKGLSYDEDKYAVITEVFKGQTEGENIGYTFGITTKGYSAGLNLTVGISKDGLVEGVKIGSHSETPGLGAKAATPAFTDQFAGYGGPFLVVKSPASKDGDVSAITGATITSKAVTEAVNLALSFYDEYLKGA